jgi:hypothetical protein
VRTEYGTWPLALLTSDGEPPPEVRAAVLDLLAEALRRDEPFAAVVTVAPEAAPPADAGPDALAAEHARAVKALRPVLAERCRGLAFVAAAPIDSATGTRFWGCPVLGTVDAAAGLAWARERLAAAP